MHRETGPRCNRLLPLWLADWMIASDTLAEFVQLVRDVFAVDNLKPVLRSRNGPLRDPAQVAVIANRVEARPVPLLGRIDQTLAQRIALNVSTDTDQGISVLDWNRLEPALVNGAGAARPMSAVPSVGMSARKPVHPV